MITPINPSDVKSDMLKAESNVQEILRALYFYGTDYIMILMGRRERLAHKEQLVALLEQGREMSTIEDIMSAALSEPLSARMQIEEIPRSTALLVFSKRGPGQSGELSRTTFETFRERKIKDPEVIFEEWWGVPLPLIHIDGDRVFMNDRALETVPCDAKTLARQADRMKRDRIATVRDKKHEKTYSLQPLSEGTFLLEDISEDFEMAEELVWWAAVGRAFFHRLEENGAVVRRVSPYEDPPATAAEVIPCSWEGENLGSLAIELPADMPDVTPGANPPPATPGLEPDKGAILEPPAKESAAAKEEITLPVRRPKRGNKALGNGTNEFSRNGEISAPPVTEEDIKNEEDLMKMELEESADNTGNFARLNKNAARKAYGGGVSRRPTDEKQN